MTVSDSNIALFFIKICANPGIFSFIFGLFKQTIQFLQQINLKNVMSGAGIRTHNLQSASLLP